MAVRLMFGFCDIIGHSVITFNEGRGEKQTLCVSLVSLFVLCVKLHQEMMLLLYPFSVCLFLRVVLHLLLRNARVMFSHASQQPTRTSAVLFPSRPYSHDHVFANRFLIHLVSPHISFAFYASGAGLAKRTMTSA